MAPTSDEVVIELVADPAGYLWSFPRPDHLAIGMCAQADAGISPGGVARSGTRLDRTLASRRRRSARTVCLADSVARCLGVRRARPGVRALGPRRRCRRARRSDHARRHLLRAAGPVSGQPTAVADGRFPRDYTARIRDEIAPDLALRRAIQGRILPAGVHEAAHPRAAAERRRSRDPRRPGRGTAVVSVAQMAIAQDGWKSGWRGR